MASVKLADFSKGITQFWRDGYGHRLIKNMRIRRNGKLVQRDGTLYAGSSDDDQHPDGSKEVKAVVHVTEDAQTVRWIVANDKLYQDYNWVEKTGIEDGNSLSYYLDENTRLHKIARQYYLLTGGNRALKIIAPSGGGGLQYHHAGLPSISSPTVTPEAADGCSYIWFFHYYYEWTDSLGTTRVERGPVTQVQHTNAGDYSTAANGNDISGITALTNGATKAYDRTVIKIKIYRTEDGGTVGKYAGEVTNGTTTFEDDVADSSLGAEIYTTGGVIEDEEPVNPVNSTYVNDCLYYAYRHKIFQSKRNAPTACPSSFYLNFGQTIEGLDNVNGYPIVFLETGVYRVEGFIDDTGRGSMRKKEIAFGPGYRLTNANAVIRCGKLLYWAGVNGVYVTDGFTFTCITEDVKDVFVTWYFTDACYFEHRKEIYFLTNGNSIAVNGEVVTKPVWVYNIEKKSWVVNSYPFRITAIDNYYDYTSAAAFGTSDGYLYKTYINNNDYDASYWDYLVDSFVALEPVVMTGLITGGTITRKIIQKVKAVFAYPEGSPAIDCAADTGFMSYQVAVDLDGDELTTSNLKEMRKEYSDSSKRGLFYFSRNMPSDARTAVGCSLEISKAATVITNSDTDGTATGDNAANTVTLGAAITRSYADWGSFYFEDDDYVQEYPVVSLAGAVYTVTDTNNTLPDGAGQKWVFKAKDYSAPMDIYDLELEYLEQSGSYESVNETDSGMNA